MALTVKLFIIEQPDCVYCARFNRKIDPAYPKTDEGKFAPCVRCKLRALGQPRLQVSEKRRSHLYLYWLRMAWR